MSETMILPLLIAATAPALSAPPVVPYAQARSIAYRDCVAAEHRRRPAAAVAEIGHGACAGKRSKLFSEVHGHIGYGWRATAKTDRQEKRMKAQLRANAEAEVVRFETLLRDWLSNGGGAGG
jgi:hypothetical protein